MRSSGVITLFSEPPAPHRRPSPFLVSILLHASAAGLIWFGLHHSPRVLDADTQQYTVKLLELDQRQSPLQWQPRSAVAAATQAAGNSAGNAQGRSPVPTAAPMTTSPAQAARLLRAARRTASLVSSHVAPQTLVQPDLPRNLVLPERIPLPRVVLWFPRNVLVKQIVPPPRQEITAANVHPSLMPPNEALNLADIKISPSIFVTKLPTIAPSSVSPIAVKDPQPIQQAPQTSSVSNVPPTPVRVLSLADLRLDKATIALPPVNEVAPAAGLKEIAENLPAISSFPGTTPGSGADRGSDTGNGSGAGNGIERSAGNGVGRPGPGTGAAVAAVKPSGPGSGSGVKAPTTQSVAGDAASANESGGAVTRIERPKGGQFGFVVIGSSPEELYPEAPNLWAGRLAYTVYLHVGLPKSWILEYSLPRTVQAADGGEVAPPKAPWPYLMVRPNLASGDLYADAIMVHGFVSASGKFQKLSIAFPAQFPQRKFVLNSLEQWRFRPATENGRPAEVEILLIIPEDTE